MKTLILYFSLLFLSIDAIAQDKLSDMPLSKIEEGYWDCDYASSTSFLGADDAAACSFIFEELKSRKFKGNFQEFMTWWRANKDVQYKTRSSKK